MKAPALPGLEPSAGYVSAGATFSTDRVYRYTLWREWQAAPVRILWIMLNPSTADEHVLDATLRRVEGFSRQWRYGGFVVCNLFALRSTDPKGLYAHPAPIGEVQYGHNVNDDAIRTQADRCSAIVLGWGSEKIAADRAAHVEKLLTGYRLSCLGRNADGQPKHPLYLPASTERWSWVA
jgi:hypothetical protein